MFVSLHILRIISPFKCSIRLPREFLILSLMYEAEEVDVFDQQGFNFVLVTFEISLVYL